MQIQWYQPTAALLQSGLRNKTYMFVFSMPSVIAKWQRHKDIPLSSQRCSLLACKHCNTSKLCSNQTPQIVALSPPQTHAHRTALNAACVSDEGACTDPWDTSHSSRSPFRFYYELVPYCCWLPPAITPLMSRGVKTVIMWKQHREIKFAATSNQPFAKSAVLPLGSEAVSAVQKRNK